MGLLCVFDQCNGGNIITRISKSLSFCKRLFLDLGIQSVGIFISLVLKVSGFRVSHKPGLNLNKRALIIFFGSQCVRFIDDGSNLLLIELGVVGTITSVKQLRYSKNSSTNKKYYCQNSGNHHRHFALFLRYRTKGVDSRCGLLLGCGRSLTNRSGSVIAVCRLAYRSSSVQVACTNLICTVRNAHKCLLHLSCRRKTHIRIIGAGTENKVCHSRRGITRCRQIFAMQSAVYSISPFVGIKKLLFGIQERQTVAIEQTVQHNAERVSVYTRIVFAAVGNFGSHIVERTFLRKSAGHILHFTGNAKIA